MPASTTVDIIKQLKRYKDIKIGKEEVKLSWFVYVFLYRKPPERSTKKLLQLMNEGAGYKTNTQKSADFYTLTVSNLKENYENNSFILASKTVKYLGVNSTKEVEGTLETTKHAEGNERHGRRHRCARAPGGLGDTVLLRRQHCPKRPAGSAPSGQHPTVFLPDAAVCPLRFRWVLGALHGPDDPERERSRGRRLAAKLHDEGAG